MCNIQSTFCCYCPTGSFTCPYFYSHTNWFTLYIGFTATIVSFLTYLIHKCSKCGDFGVHSRNALEIANATFLTFSALKLRSYACNLVFVWSGNPKPHIYNILLSETIRETRNYIWRTDNEGKTKLVHANTWCINILYFARNI